MTRADPSMMIASASGFVFDIKVLDSSISSNCDFWHM